MNPNTNQANLYASTKLTDFLALSKIDTGRQIALSYFKNASSTTKMRKDAISALWPRSIFFSVKYFPKLIFQNLQNLTF